MRFVDYKCSQCGQVSELVVTADSDIKCPGCGSSGMQRIFSGPNLANKNSVQADSTSSKSCSGSCTSCSGCS
ncbi:MAG: hypothetical protein K9H14_07340 [Actinomycetia bacterium]|nr:hypothetical protein [Actinomycetes bacterium]